jgi:hypothetical protein
VQHLWERVLQGTGEAVGHAHCIPDQAATVFDELCEGAPRRTLLVNDPKCEQLLP